MAYLYTFCLHNNTPHFHFSSFYSHSMNELNTSVLGYAAIEAFLWIKIIAIMRILVKYIKYLKVELVEKQRKQEKIIRKLLRRENIMGFIYNKCLHNCSIEKEIKVDFDVD